MQSRIRPGPAERRQAEDKQSPPPLSHADSRHAVDIETWHLADIDLETAERCTDFHARNLDDTDVDHILGQIGRGGRIGERIGLGRRNERNIAQNNQY